MNLSQNQFVPPNLPPQMVNSALQYNVPSSFVGKVIRIRPNIYAFICDYCLSQHQSIDQFLRHTELHFQHNEISNAIPSAMTPAMTPIGASSNLNGSTASPYPVQLQHSQSVPMNQDANFTDEVYEIIDLGYDFDGNFPNAKNIDDITIDGNGAQQSKPKQQRSPSKPKARGPKAKNQRTKPNNLVESANKNTSKKCSFCVRVLSSEIVLKRHIVTAHAKILKKILCQKKAFKCKICEEKFPKSIYTLDDAQEHLKSHYNN